MYIKQDMDFNDLMNNCWSGAIDTLKTIEEHDKEDELMQYLEEACDDCPSLTYVNDLLWFDSDFIFECLGISETEEEEEEIEYEEGVTEQDCIDFNSFCRRYECEKCPYNDHCRTIDDCRTRYLELKWPDDEEEK